MSNLGAVHLVFYLYEVSPHPHSHFISSEICKERKSRRSALDFGAVEVCLLNSHAFFPSFLGTPFCTVDIIRNSRNCPYTMTQNPWNHASDWGHGSQLSHSFPFMFAWTSTLASLLILITTSEAQGSRGWEPRGGIWRTVLGGGDLRPDHQGSQSCEGTSGIVRFSLPCKAGIASSIASLKVGQSLLIHLQGQKLTTS